MEDEEVFEASKEKTTSGKHKYAISFWNINTGGTPY